MVVGCVLKASTSRDLILDEIFYKVKCQSQPTNLLSSMVCHSFFGGRGIGLCKAFSLYCIYTVSQKSTCHFIF